MPELTGLVFPIPVVRKLQAKHHVLYVLPSLTIKSRMAHSRRAPGPDYVLRGSDDAITSLLYTTTNDECNQGKDTLKLIAGMQNGMITTWNLKTRRAAHKFQAHQGSVLAIIKWDNVRQSESHTQLDTVLQATESNDEPCSNAAKPIATSEEGKLDRLMQESPTKNTVEIPKMVTKTQCLIITHGREGVIYTWAVSPTEWSKLKTFDCSMQGFCSAIVLTLDSPVVAMPTDSHKAISVVNLVTMEPVATLKADQAATQCGMCMCMQAIGTTDGNNDRQRLLSGHEDGSVTLWAISPPGAVSRASFHGDMVTCLDYHRGNNAGVSGSVDNALVWWAISGDGQLECLGQVTLRSAGVSGVRWRDDGRLLAAACWGGSIELVSRRRKPLAVLNFHGENALSLTFSPGDAFAVGSKDTTISVWSVYQQK